LKLQCQNVVYLWCQLNRGKAWRYQRVHQKPQIQAQTIQWPKEKGQTLIYKTLHKTKEWATGKYSWCTLHPDQSFTHLRLLVLLLSFSCKKMYYHMHDLSITGLVTRVTLWMRVVVQVLLNHYGTPEVLSDFCWVPVDQSLVFFCWIDITL
jgi:hypothetical protein